MFKKVRRNFIIIAMASVSLILIIVNVVVCVVNFNKSVSSSDEIIALIERDHPIEEAIINDAPDPRIGDSRYFFVTYNNEDKKIIEIDLKHIEKSIVSETVAINYARDVINTNNQRGYKDNYRYHVSKYENNINRIAFLDCQRSMQSYSIFVQVIFFSSLGALLAYFLIIFLGSKYILKPIKDSYDKQNRFITNASHQLKTPLTIISANNELIGMQKGNNQYTNNINKQVNRMNEMIKDLTTLSRLNEGYKMHFENIDCKDLLNKQLKQLRIVCQKEKLKLLTHLDAAQLNFDKNIFNQIISIVLDNARKYSKSKIEVTLKTDGKSVIFTERNDCESIEEGDLIQYAERFYRSDKNSYKSDGSGIGLSLLEELAKITNSKLKIYGKNNTYNLEIVFINKSKVKDIE